MAILNTNSLITCVINTKSTFSNESAIYSAIRMKYKDGSISRCQCFQKVHLSFGLNCGVGVHSISIDTHRGANATCSDILVSLRTIQ